MLLVITIVIVTIVITIIIVATLKPKNIYHTIDQWNQRVIPIRNEQNLVHDINLPLSMQYVNSTCNLPIAIELNTLITQNHNQILQETLDLLKTGYKGFPMSEIDDVQKKFVGNNQWSPIWIKFVGQYANTAKYIPTLTNIVKQFGNEIVLLHISVFWPPVSLKKHSGIHMGVYRYHYGLYIPNGDTGMIVNDVYYRWKNGEGVIWDDTLPHTSWNQTNEPRLIIFADLLRNLPNKYENEKMYTLIEKSNSVKQIHKKLGHQRIPNLHQKHT